MVKIFEHIKYDLSQNLLKYNCDLSRNLLLNIYSYSESISNTNYEGLFSLFCNEVISLYYHSLILTISHVYKDSEIVEAIKEAIDSLEDPNILTNNDILEMKELESKAMKKFEEYCQSTSIDIDNINYKFQIRNVLIQIFDFLMKGVLCNSVHVNIYLRNLTFTNQGTINMKKTILRILKEPCLSPTSKFELACYYFIDDSTIRNLYFADKSEEEEEEKYFTSNTKFITDYSLYYWEWQIRGTRRLVTEASSFYLQSRSPWSRADMQSDVAILIIFQKAIEENNELAVQYLWVNHISKMPKSEEKLSDAIRLAASSSTEVNTCLFLIFQIQNNELKSLLKEISLVILKNMIKNVRWYYLFMKIFNELKIYLSSKAMAELLSCLAKSHCQDYPFGFTYKTISEYICSMPVRAYDSFRARYESEN
ncbi:UNVERIFIED_CONTAM: hypothetical protein RMT77_015414 [Armadillidium vulgare]